MNVFDLLFIVLVLLGGHRLIDWVVVRYQLGGAKRLLIWLFYFQLGFSILFGWYVTVYGGDARGYWRIIPEYETANFSIWSFYNPGTSFIRFITYPLVHILGLSFWTGCLIFGLIGFGGFVIFFLILNQTINSNPKLFGFKIFPMILFLPNMHFWSSGIGKDSIMFLSLNLFVYSMMSPAKNIPGLVLSLYLSFYVRPHIALIMIVAMAFSMVTSLKGLNLFLRIVYLVGTIILFLFILPQVLEIIHIEEGEINQLDEISASRASGLIKQSVGSAIDISNYPVWLRMFTFLFRPLFFDSPNFFGFLVSIENAFYLTLTILLLLPISWKSILILPIHLKAALFILISSTYFLSSSLSNLGLIIRQKNMVMFMLVLVSSYVITQSYNTSVRKQSVI